MEHPRAGRVFLRLLVALVVLGGLYGGLAVFVGRHVPTNTTVDGIAIGGMSPDEATVTLQRVLATRASQPIHLQTPSRTVDIDPGTAGLEVDAQATLSSLTGFTWNPIKVWAHLTRGEDQRLKTRVDRAKLTAAVSDAARAINYPVTEGSITFTDGRATAVVSVAGQAVKVRETTDAVASKWPREPVVEAVMDLMAPTVSAGEINRAATEFAGPAMSGPVNVVTGQISFVVHPAQYAPALSLAPDGFGRLRPSIDASRLLFEIRKANPGIERAPVDAKVRLVAGVPRVVPAVTGMRFDEQTIGAPFLAALTSPTRTAMITMVSDPPR